MLFGALTLFGIPLSIVSNLILRVTFLQPLVVGISIFWRLAIFPLQPLLDLLVSVALALPLSDLVAVLAIDLCTG